jgi:hypothetical protein
MLRFKYTTLLVVKHNFNNFIYGFFNDPVSSLDYTALNDNNEWKDVARSCGALI